MQKGKKFREVVLFLASSGITGLLYMGGLYFFETTVRFPFYIGVSLAYALAMAFYFLTNKFLVFQQDRGSKTGGQVRNFVILVTINYLLTLGIVTAVKSMTGEVYSGSVIAGVVTITLTYFVFDRFLFKKPVRT